MLIRFFLFDFSPQLRLVLLITDTRMYFPTQIIFTSTRYSFTLLLRLFVLRPHTHLLYYSDYLYFDQVLIYFTTQIIGNSPGIHVHYYSDYWYFDQVIMYFTTQIIGTSTRYSCTLLLRLFVLQPGTHLLYYSDYLFLYQVLIYFTTQIIGTSTIH